VPDRLTLIFASILFPVFVGVGLVAMREPPTPDPMVQELPITDPDSARPSSVAAVRLARVDLRTIAARALYDNRSVERQREALSRFAPLLEACDAEFRQALDEANADPEEANRDTYLPRHLERFREIAARKRALRDSLQEAAWEAGGDSESEAIRLAREAIGEIAAREGFTAVFTMPYESGRHRWEEEDLVNAPVAWCGACEDITLEVAAAAGIPADAFDDRSAYWLVRVKLVEDFHAAIERAPWEPEGE
jgi:hypothetical protein